MQTLKHVDVLPAAKISAITAAIVGFIIGIIIFISTSFASTLLPGVHRAAVFGLGAASIIILPIVLLIVSFVITSIEVWLYNLIAGKWGGAKVDIAKNRLNRIDPLSIARVYAICGAIVGFVIGLIISIVSIFASAFAGPFALVGIAAIIIVPLLAAIGGFIFIYIVALIYNYVASKIGGVVIMLKAMELKSVGPMSYAKIEAIISGIFGLIAGIIRAIISISTTSSILPVSGIGLGLVAIILYPVFYFIIGFVTTLFAALLYNWLAPRVGPIKITLSK